MFSLHLQAVLANFKPCCWDIKLQRNHLLHTLPQGQTYTQSSALHDVAIIQLALLSLLRPSHPFSLTPPPPIPPQAS